MWHIASRRTVVGRGIANTTASERFEAGMLSCVGQSAILHSVAIGAVGRVGQQQGGVSVQILTFLTITRWRADLESIQRVQAGQCLWILLSFRPPQHLANFGSTSHSQSSSLA